MVFQNIRADWGWGVGVNQTFPSFSNSSGNVDSPDTYRTERNVMYLLHRRRVKQQTRHEFGRIKRRRCRVFGDDRYTGKIKRTECNA